MKILITGATGFLGSHLVRNLIKNNEIIILKRSFDNTNRINDILTKINYFDIDKHDLRTIFEDNNIDVIVHTATDYGRNHRSTVKTVDTNVMFALNVLELAVHFNTTTFINSDTILHRNINDYSLSKKQFLEWLKRNAGKIQVVNLKLEHMYGPGNNTSEFVTGIVNKMINNELKIKFTRGEQKRDFVYIDDVVSAYETIINNLSNINMDFNEFEIGSGEVISIKKFVEIIHELTESKSILKFGSLPYRKYETMYSKADLKRIKELGWEPKNSIKEGLIKIIKYNRSKNE